MLTKENMGPGAKSEKNKTCLLRSSEPLGVSPAVTVCLKTILSTHREIRGSQAGRPSPFPPEVFLLFSPYVSWVPEMSLKGPGWRGEDVQLSKTNRIH